MNPIACPFTILVDTAEGQPFTFTGFKADSDKNYAPLTVGCQFSNLGRYPDSLGDYSIAGLVGRVHVERKSVGDAWSTILGWETEYESNRNLAGHRDRFEKELENLSKIEAGLVVVEATRDQCIDLMPARGKKSIAENRKIFYRTTISFMQKYPVHWVWSSSRRAAEVDTFRWLEMFWRKRLTAAERKAIVKQEQAEPW